MQAVSKYHPLSHYVWGSGCDGWNLLASDGLSVKQERMPPSTVEKLHYHQHAQQFFFILTGTATFEVEGEIIHVKSGEGLHIEAMKKHRISNQTAEDLEFLLCSQPTTTQDRINENG